MRAEPQQHTADELKAISKAVNLLAEKGIFTLEELDAALSSVSDKASEIRGTMKPREARIKQLQKLIEQAQNFQKTKPVHDEYKQIRWKGKQEKFAETHRADLTIWEAANRYLRANLPDMKLTPISNRSPYRPTTYATTATLTRTGISA